MKKILLFISFYCWVSLATVFAEQSPTVEMADALRSSGKIYVVISTIVIIFIGLAIYLFSIDRRLKKIERNK